VNVKNVNYVFYSSKESTEGLRDFYKEEMLRLGWKLEKEIDMSSLYKAYKQQKAGKKAPNNLLPFGDVTFQQFIQGGHMLYFKGYGARAEVSILNNNFANNQGSLVQIRYAGE
jgi:hypothetical protein